MNKSYAKKSLSQTFPLRIFCAQDDFMHVINTVHAQSSKKIFSLSIVCHPIDYNYIPSAITLFEEKKTIDIVKCYGRS